MKSLFYEKRIPRVNRWDIAAFLLVMGGIALLAWGSRQMAVPYTPGQEIPLSLDPQNLPVYALRSVLRMAIALAFSLVFAMAYATWAAKSKRAETVLIPTLDILQSVPILGFLSITVAGFIALFPGSLLGVEAAAIFAIFTSQVWNMAFSFYQSLRMIPRELHEASVVFGLSPWQRFWRLEAPFATPNLIWNTMMSVSGGWFFVVAAEAITVGKTEVTLPGIGSYVAQAIILKDLHAIGWAILTMFIVILIYDQLLFRPLVAWAEKFKFEMTESQDVPQSWFLMMFKRARFFRSAASLTGRGWSFCVDHLPRLPRPELPERKAPILTEPRIDLIWNITLWSALGCGAWFLVRFVGSEVPVSEVFHVLYLGLLTLIRVMVLLVLASVIWIPIGVMIGLSPKWSMRAQPVAQFMAAFPANLLFPIVVFLLIRYDLSPEIWTAPLMILGAQWYILFNVISGASSIPGDLREAAKSLGIKGWKLWKKLLLPGIFPALVTGLITAAGGTWNASIVAEIVSWGDTELVATGLGSYITQWSRAGDYPRIVLGVVVMSTYVVVLNRFLWSHLYNMCQSRYRLD